MKTAYPPKLLYSPVLWTAIKYFMLMKTTRFQHPPVGMSP